MGYIYVGPQFRSSALRAYHFYREIPKPYADHPVYRHLFVPPEKLDEAKQRVAKKGDPLHTFYQKAIKAHKKKEAN